MSMLAEEGGGDAFGQVAWKFAGNDTAGAKAVAAAAFEIFLGVHDCVGMSAESFAFLWRLALFVEIMIVVAWWRWWIISGSCMQR